jgi:hypothetical protein
VGDVLHTRDLLLHVWTATENVAPAQL